jgi:hypothetical protein
VFPGSPQIPESKMIADDESFSSQNAPQVVPPATFPSKKTSWPAAAVNV